MLTDVADEDDVDVLLLCGDGLHSFRLLFYPSLNIKHPHKLIYFPEADYGLRFVYRSGTIFEILNN